MDKKILKKATADNSEPCAGWMFKAIANMTKASPSACESVCDWLVSRLINNKSPHVKKKCLNVIRSVATYGDSEFARLIVRRSEEIKKFASFRGPADPLHGDSLNQAVRTAASEAIDAIFERTEQGSRVASTNLNLGGWNPSSSTGNWGGPDTTDYSTNDKYEGFGSNNTGTPTSSTSQGIGSQSSGKYQGFGSQPYTPTANQTETQGWKVTGIVSSLWNKGPSKPYTPDESLMGHWEHDAGRYQSPIIPSTGFTPTSNQPPNFGQSHWKDEETAKISRSDTSGAFEQKIVEEFTTPSKIRVQPTRQELNAFCSRCGGVNIELIAKALDEKLADQKWQIRLKALYGIEALIRAQNEVVYRYFSENFDNLGAQTEAVQESIQTKAQKILEVLTTGVIDDEEETNSPKTTKKPVTNNRKKTIDFQPTNTSETQSNSSGNSLLGFDNEMFQSEQQPQSSGDDLADMFSTMEIKTNHTSNIASNTPKSAPTTTTTTDDFFDTGRNRANSAQNVLDQFFTATPTTPVIIQQPIISTVQTNQRGVYPQPQVIYVPVQTQFSQPLVVPVARPPVNQQRPLQQGPPRQLNSFDFINDSESKAEETDHFAFVRSSMK